MTLELMDLRREERQAPDGLYPVLPVIWVFQNYDGRWAVHLEGEDSEWCHSTRGDAVVAARLIGESYGCYRLHLQLTDGRFCLEMMNLSRARG
ncbi:MAG: hypothetical protein L0I29_01445 [Hyphomicrobiales bacterium]|nr:hypothetical protein [Hyphomicrobiales bacterium]